MTIPLLKEIPFHQFGVEFEFFGTGILDVRSALIDLGLQYKEWDIDYDGSVSKHGNGPIKRKKIQDEDESSLGLELRSPPLKGQDGIDQLKGACKLLETMNVETNETTGFHVHFDCSDYDFETIKRIVKAFLVYEDGLELFIFTPRERMYNDCSYARSLSSVFAETDVHKPLQEQMEERGRIAEERFTAQGGFTHKDIFEFLHSREGCFHDNNTAEKMQAVRKGLQAVDACKTLDDLIALVGHERNFKLNIMPLKTLGTIEYRQSALDQICFDHAMYVVGYFDLFLTLAVDDALPMADWLIESGFDTTQNILTNLTTCTPSPGQGYIGVPWQPGMEKFARRFWPDFSIAPNGDSPSPV